MPGEVFSKVVHVAKHGAGPFFRGCILQKLWDWCAENVCIVDLGEGADLAYVFWDLVCADCALDLRRLGHCCFW